ncbi:MAG: HupE/UreJ family protein [Planctomycetes bacterium]|nr:HupE/UreJ family protein [Planctomycetota bacterium]
MPAFPRRSLVPLALLMASAPLLVAHPGHGGVSLAAGAAHPWSGIDHLLAMVAVGILAVRIGGRGLWLVPLSFLCGTLGGTLIGFLGATLPAVETAIAVSVLALGVVIAIGRSPRLGMACALVGAFAIPHGIAHAAESGGAVLAPFAVGMIASTALLHLLGIAFGVMCRDASSQRPIRWSGALIAVSGLALMAC